MENIEQKKVGQKVNERYGRIALSSGSCCAPGSGSAERIEPLAQSGDIVGQGLPGRAVQSPVFPSDISAKKPGAVPKGRKERRPLDAKEMKMAAYRHFETGLHCAEVISRTLLEHFLDEPRPDMVRAASAFGGGIAGTTRELCGAFTGGVLALGFLTGRSRGGETLKECSDLARAFTERFRREFGSLQCPAILAGFGAEEQARRCARLTAGSAVILAELLEAFERERSVDFSAYRCQPRDRIPAGGCPFGG